jgi:hypothetical protein
LFNQSTQLDHHYQACHWISQVLFLLLQVEIENCSNQGQRIHKIFSFPPPFPPSPPPPPYSLPLPPLPLFLFPPLLLLIFPPPFPPFPPLLLPPSPPLHLPSNFLKKVNQPTHLVRSSWFLQ